MKKMIAALLCAILGFGAIFVLLISMNWVAFAESDYSYSRRLIKSIENGDYTAVLSILSERPSCVNSLTSPIPKTLCSLVDYRPIYPLIAACCSGDMKMVMYLVEHGADVNCNDGRTPLSLTYSAKVPNWYEISTYLIANGASLDYQTEYSANMSSVLYDIVQVRPGAALEGYVAENDEDVIAAFRFAINNANLNRVNWSQVINSAVSNDRTEIVSFLLEERYCDVNDLTTGMAPLMYAVRDSDEEMIKLLLSYGADITCVSSDGKSAYDYAVEKGYADIASLLVH